MDLEIWNVFKNFKQRMNFKWISNEFQMKKKCKRKWKLRIEKNYNEDGKRNFNKKLKYEQKLKYENEEIKFNWNFILFLN